MQIAFIFPGQGSQYHGMGRAIAEAHPEAAEVFALADQALEEDLSALCFHGSEAELALTENTQPAVLAASLAVFRVLESRGQLPDFVAGHSLGEYSAIVAAGGMDLADAVKTVRARGRFMQDAVPVGAGAMAAVLGLEDPAVEQVCREAAGEQVVAAANYNAPGQVVIAGHREAVERAAALARERGAGRVLPLPVSAPFHCQLMRPARQRLAELMGGMKLSPLRFPLVNNVRAARVERPDEVVRGLIDQVASAVLWAQSVKTLIDLGVGRFVEVGPGRVLAGLVRRIDRDVEAVSIESPQQVEAYCSLAATG